MMFLSSLQPVTKQTLSSSVSVSNTVLHTQLTHVPLEFSNYTPPQGHMIHTHTIIILYSKIGCHENNYYMKALYTSVQYVFKLFCGTPESSQLTEVGPLICFIWDHLAFLQRPLQVSRSHVRDRCI